MYGDEEPFTIPIERQLPRGAGEEASLVCFTNAEKDRMRFIFWLVQTGQLSDEIPTRAASTLAKG